MVVVKTAVENPTPVEKIKTSDLKAYKEDSEDPYITAYLKADRLPLMSFVIGDEKKYNSESTMYVNKALKKNSSYIVFLRFFESEVKLICHKC